MKFKIPLELLQMLINYLQTKPYAEVAQLIDGLVKLEQDSIQPIEEKEDK